MGSDIPEEVPVTHLSLQGPTMGLFDNGSSTRCCREKCNDERSHNDRYVWISTFGRYETSDNKTLHTHHPDASSIG